MALLGKLHKESYRKIRRRRRRSYPEYQPPERQRITKVEKFVKGNYEQIIAAKYVEGTRKAKRLELYSGTDLAVIELQKDNSYTITRLHPTSSTRKVVELKFNQRTGTLTWFEVNDDGTVGPEQRCGIEEEILTTAALLLFFPIGWFLIPFRPQLRSISKSWNSLLDSAADAYSER